MARKLKVKLVRSVIGRPRRQKLTAWTLGLRRMGSSVVHEATPQIRGMVSKISHLVEVEEIEGKSGRRGGNDAGKAE